MPIVSPDPEAPRRVRAQVDGSGPDQHGAPVEHEHVVAEHGDAGQREHAAKVELLPASRSPTTPSARPPAAIAPACTLSRPSQRAITAAAGAR